MLDVVAACVAAGAPYEFLGFLDDGEPDVALLDVAAELEDLRCLVDARTQDVEPLLGKIAEERALLAKRLGQVRVALADLAARGD